MIVRSKFLRLIVLSALVVVATVIAACSSEEEATPAPVVQATAVVEATEEPVVEDVMEEVEASDKLVNAGWMLENLDNEDVVVIDLRKEEDYVAGHIPGALRLTPNPVFQQEDENNRVIPWSWASPPPLGNESDGCGVGWGAHLHALCCHRE